jgi:hypothetical protein
MSLALFQATRGDFRVTSTRSDMVNSSVAEERKLAWGPAQVFNLHPVSGQTCHMMVSRERRGATLLTHSSHGDGGGSLSPLPDVKTAHSRHCILL